MLKYQNQFHFFLIFLDVTNGLKSLSVSDTSEQEMQQTCLPMRVNKTQPGSTLNPQNSLFCTHVTTVTFIHTYIRTHTYIHTYVRTYIHSYKTFYARSQTFEKRLLALSCLSIRMEQLGFCSMNFHEIWYFSISQKSVQKIQVSLLLTRMTGTLHEDVCTFMTSSHWILLREKYFKEK